MPRITARENVINRWQEKWRDGTHGRWTYRLIPNIRRWMDRPYGEVDYFITQALSGHGCFKKYLYERNRADTDVCVYCSSVDDSEHTLFECSKWAHVRTEYTQKTGRIFNPENMVEGLVTSDVEWNNSYEVIRYIIENKEKDARR